MIKNLNILEKQLISKITIYNSTTSSDEQKYFYKNSYPEILVLFQATQTLHTKDWAIRVGLVHSWLQKIPTPNFNIDLLRSAFIFEDELKEKLKTPKNKSSIIKSLLNNSTVFDEYYFTLNRILNNIDFPSDRQYQNLPSVTKMLHFIFPELFIIVDSNTRPYLLSESPKTPGTQDLSDYKKLTLDLIDFLESDQANVLKVLSKKTNLSPIRLLDIYLFHQ